MEGHLRSARLLRADVQDINHAAATRRAHVRQRESTGPNGREEFQVEVSLPNQNETTTNGTLPVGTIQGLNASITWTFSEAQRTATTTNS